MKRSPTLIASPAGQPARRRRAIVLGASLAGLLAARVLHERFDEVLLLERDALPDGPMLRKGTPHTGHAHGLLARGRIVIEALFPGVTEALRAQGAQSGDLGADISFYSGTRRFANAPVGLAGIAVSRPRLEAELRRRVRALPGVQLRAEVDVIEPEYDRVRRRVTGVRFSQRGDGIARSPAADLVVDCTGRGSRSPAWLQGWGYAAVPEQRVQVGMGYVTAYFRREPQHAPGISAAICSATPETPRPGVLLAQEPADGDDTPRWVVTLGGYAGDHIPSTLEAMRERAASMASPELTRVVQRADMLGTPTAYRFPHSQRRRYERLARFPQGYLVFGDALASFNPIFGQGMSVAACEALALADALERESLGDGLARRFFRAASKVIDVPWSTAVRADLAIVGQPGTPGLAARLMNAYMQRLFRAAEHDAQVANAFRKVTHLVAPPASLLAPALVARVLWGSRGAATKASGGVSAARTA